MLGKLILSILFIAAAGSSDNPSIELTFSGDGDVSFALTGNWSASAPTPVPAPTPAIAPAPTPAHVHGTAVVACDDCPKEWWGIFGVLLGGFIVHLIWNDRMRQEKKIRSSMQHSSAPPPPGIFVATPLPSEKGPGYRPVQRDIQFV